MKMVINMETSDLDAINERLSDLHKQEKNERRGIKVKNIEFYHDEIIENRYFHSIFEFAKEKGMKQKKGSTNTLELIDWLNEEHQILDEEEKKYLSSVIKPFKKRILYIRKCEDLGFECIQIGIDSVHECLNEYVQLPLFEKNTMYKGMECYLGYTPEELGL